MCSSAGPCPWVSLDDWLVDPLTRLLMQADNVDPAHIRQIFRSLSHQHTDAAVASPGGCRPVSSERSAGFRSGVGIMLLNHDGRVFVGRRIRTPGDAWQMPQGGIDEDEAPVAAALRELREEVGTDNVRVLAESDAWLGYELPPELAGKAWQGRWRGQQQKWFAMRFLGSDDEINIATEHPEFSAWRWVPAVELPALIVSFKRQLYLDVIQRFRSVVSAHQSETVVGGAQVKADAAVANRGPDIEADRRDRPP